MYVDENNNKSSNAALLWMLHAFFSYEEKYTIWYLVTYFIIITTYEQISNTHTHTRLHS